MRWELLGLISILGTFMACGKTSFQGNTATKTESQSSKAEVQPLEKDGGLTETSSSDIIALPQTSSQDDLVVAQSSSLPLATPTPTPKICLNKHQPVRIGFVVDNSGSNSAEPGKVQEGMELRGTDPIQKKPDGTLYTNRQDAIFKSISHIIELDQKAKKDDASFKGSSFGIAYFPKETTSESSGNYEILSGKGTAFKTVMTESFDLFALEDYSKKIWEDLKFTHNPQGLTPYRSALEAAQKLMMETRKEGDNRKEIIFLLTDGLPSDKDVEYVQEAFKELNGIELILLSIYSPGLSTEEQNAPARESLEKAWETLGWGKTKADKTPSSFTTFDDYWKALVALPGKISNSEIRVDGGEELYRVLDNKILEVINCE